MGCFSSKIGSGEKAVPKWTVFLHSNEARNRYNDDPSMPRDCSMSMLEFRLFLDDPILIRTLGMYVKKTAYTHLFMSWIDIQEFKSLNAENVAFNRKVALKIYDKYINPRAKAPIVNSSIVDDAAADIIYSVLKPTPEQSFFSFGSGSQKVKPIPNSLFDEVQLNCFLRIHELVFIPYQRTESYNSISDRVINYNKVKADDFEYYSKVGKGGFGVVVHGVKISTGVHYAIKIQTKQSLLQCFHDCPHRVDYEKQAMAKCKHPFIISLDYSFQTPTLAVMVMELGRAGTLKDALEKCDLYMMGEDRVQFYCAEICLALLHLHEVGLMYRDLKPENILLSSLGHIKLVDLGGVIDPKEKLLKNPATNYFSSMFSSFAVENPNHKSKKQQSHHGHGESTGRHSANHQSTMRARSVMGTRGFMAPEMLRMRDPQYYYEGYSKAVDWWSLGVTAFELLTGHSPFSNSDLLAIANRASKDNLYDDTYTNDATDFSDEAPIAAELLVIFQRLEHCGNNISPALGNLVRSFLTLNARHRLGAGPKGAWNIKNHAAFAGIDWEQLEQLQIQPPFVPPCSPFKTAPLHADFESMIKAYMPLGSGSFFQDYYFKNWDYVSAHSQTMEMSQVLETEQIVRMGSSSMSGTWARSGSIKTAL